MEKNVEVQLIKFEVGDILFSLQLEIIDEVFSKIDLISVPHVSEYIEGIAIPRDSIVTIADLAKILQINRNPKENRILAVTYKGNRVGLRVDSITGISTEVIRRNLLDADEYNAKIDNEDSYVRERKIIKDDSYTDKNYYNKYKKFTSGYAISEGKQIIVLDHMKIIRSLINEE